MVYCCCITIDNLILIIFGFFFISKTMLDPNSMTTSICVLDNENIITGSNQLKWWNWPKKQLLKTFSGHSNEIRFLRPILFPTINSSSSSSSSTIDVYLLSSAVSDRYINLWYVCFSIIFQLKS